MKNSILKKYTLIILAMILAFAMCACTVDPSDDGSDLDTITVTMNVDFPDGEDGEYPEDIEGFKMQVESGATIMQILEGFAGQYDLEVTVDDSSETVYVTSIGEVAAGKNSGWTYSINDNAVMEEAATCTPENGDNITWEFVNF